jgi:hypothetical protein
MAEEIVIGKLIIDNSDLDRAMFESKQSIIELEVEQKKLKKETENLSSANEEQLTTFVANEASLKRLRSEYSQNQKTVLAIVKAQSGLDDELKKVNRSQDEAIINTKALTEARRKVDTTTVEGSKVIADINTKIDANNKLINGSSSALEQQKNNVGNYPTIMGAVGSSFGGATAQIIGFAGRGKEAIDEVSAGFKNYQEAQKASAVAQEAYQQAQAASTIATKAATDAQSKRTMIGFRYNKGLATETELEAANTAATTANATATSAQATATAAATTATNASAASLKLFRIALISTGIGAIVILLGSLISYLTTTQAGIDKVTSVTRPLITVFQTLLGFVQELGGGLFKMLSGDIKGGFEDIKNSSKALGQNLSIAYDRGVAIDKLMKNLSASEADFILSQGKLGEQLKIQNQIAEDTTKTIAEREAAAVKSIDIAKQINQEQRTRLLLELAILQAQAANNDTSDADRAAIANKVNEIRESNKQLAELETTQTNKVNAIRKQGASESKALTDAAFQESLKQSRNKIDLIKLEAKEQILTTEEKIANAKKVFDLENDLAKRSSSGSDQQKVLIENRQNLSNEILAITQEQIKIENDLQNSAFSELKKLSEQELTERIQGAKDLATAQILLLDSSLLSERAYADEVVKINESKNASILALNKTFEETEKTRIAEKLTNDKLFSEAEFQIRLIEITDRNATEQEIKEALLIENYSRELDLLNQSLLDKSISEGVYLKKKELAEKKFNADTGKNDKILADQKRANNIGMAQDAIGALQGLFGESKALSVASALINTYQGISAGVKLGYPAAIPAVAAAAATGFAAVKNILKTNKSSTSASSSSAPVSTGAGSFRNTEQTSTIATVSERPVEQNTIVTPPVLILESLQEVQNQVAIKIDSN